MANEPERPIEKLLRAAAQKRRDQAGAPLELHPATRRLLQGEVARRFAKPGRAARPFLEVLGQLWPRFAWATTSLAVLAVAVYALLPIPGKGKPEALLAKNEPRPTAAPAKQRLAPAPEDAPAAPEPLGATKELNPSGATFAAAVPPAQRLDTERQQLSKDGFAPKAEREPADKSALAAASQPMALKKAAETEIAASSRGMAPVPAESANGAYQRGFKSATKPAAPASPRPEPVSPPLVAVVPAPAGNVAADEAQKMTGDTSGKAPFVARSLSALALGNSAPAATDSLRETTGQDRKEAGSAVVAQRFAQVAAGPKTKESLADKVVAPPSVLASFQVEQAGSELRIVDGDGSVYSGYVQPADAVQRRRSAKAAAPTASPAPGVLGAVVEEAGRLDADQRAPQTYFFRVAGTNRSLNQEVVFTGNLMASTDLAANQPFTNALSPVSGVGGGRAESAQPALPPLLRSRISGKVVVGDGKAVEINALPSGP